MILKAVVKMSSSPIVKCSHCNQIFSSEDFNKHACKWKLKDVKRISVISFHDDSYNNHKIVRGYGTDGTVYTLVVTPRKAIALLLPLSNGLSQQNRSNEDDTVPRSTIFISQPCHCCQQSNKTSRIGLGSSGDISTVMGARRQ